MNDHHFNVQIAIDFDVETATFLNNMAYWLNITCANRDNFQEGLYWLYNSYTQWSEIFPYWSAKQMRRIIGNAIDGGLLMVGNFNKKRYDNTNWYTFTEKALEYYPKLKDQVLNTPAQTGKTPAQTGKTPAQTGRPIPNSNLISNPDNKELKTLGDSTNTPTDITPSSKIKDYEKDERFMRFYNAYPKKVKPRDAWKAFKNIIGKNEELLIKILVDLKERSSRHSQWQEKQFIPYPATYLRSADYDSEIINQNQEAERKRQESKTQAEQRIAQQESLSKQRRDAERTNNEAKQRDAFVMRDLQKNNTKTSPPPQAWSMLKRKLNIREG